jgi:hypothetical protein
VRRAHSRGLRSRTGCGAGGDSPGGYGSGPGPEPATALTHPPVLRGTRAGPQSRRHDAVDLDVVGPGDLDPWRGRASRRQARSSRRGWSTVATVQRKACGVTPTICAPASAARGAADVLGAGSGEKRKESIRSDRLLDRAGALVRGLAGRVAPPTVMLATVPTSVDAGACSEDHGAGDSPGPVSCAVAIRRDRSLRRGGESSPPSGSPEVPTQKA